jgi:hypothetical protein
MSVLEVSKDGGTTWQTLPVTFTDGVHAMMIRARDKAGNVSTVSRTMSVDTILPTLTSAKTGIFGERSWYITPVNIHLSGADVGSGVKTIQHRINGGAWTTGSSLLVSEDGVYALEYRVTDNAGNVFTLPDGLQKDTTLPNTSILSPSHLTVTDKTITVAGSSDDSMSGLDVVEISIDSGKSWQPLTLGSWSYSFDSSDMPNGELKILSRATDRAGNKFQSESSVLLANHAPQVSLPEAWVVTEAGGLSVLTDFFDISSVRITIMDSTGAVLKSQHLPVAPYHIAWDGRLEGELLPAGNYPVSVVVCDVNRKCGTATAIITIPEFSYLQPEPPVQAVPTQEVVIIPAPAIVKEEPHPAQRLFTKVLSSAKPRDAGVLLLSGGFLLFLLTQTVSDPRPRAMRSLAKTIRSTMLNKE